MYMYIYIYIYIYTEYNYIIYTYCGHQWDGIDLSRIYLEPYMLDLFFLHGKVLGLVGEAPRDRRFWFNLGALGATGLLCVSLVCVFELV